MRTTKERDLLRSRLRAGQDLCFLLASPLAWECCTEGDSYNLGIQNFAMPSSLKILRRRADSIWPLITLCRWLINYVSQIFREAVRCISVTNTNDHSGFTYLKLPKRNPGMDTVDCKVL